VSAPRRPGRPGPGARSSFSTPFSLGLEHTRPQVSWPRATGTNGVWHSEHSIAPAGTASSGAGPLPLPEPLADGEDLGRDDGHQGEPTLTVAALGPGRGASLRARGRVVGAGRPDGLAALGAGPGAAAHRRAGIARRCRQVVEVVVLGGLEVDEEQHIEAAQRDRVDVKEVAGEGIGGLGPQEL
jgi:hypothetical protein